MLNDFSWNMTGYIPKHQVNPHGDGIIPYVAERIFQLEPEPPAVDSLNEYILSALREKNLLYFSFFLHHYETQLNKRIKGFLSVDGGNLYDTCAGLPDPARSSVPQPESSCAGRHEGCVRNIPESNPGTQSRRTSTAPRYTDRCGLDRIGGGNAGSTGNPHPPACSRSG